MTSSDIQIEYLNKLSTAEFCKRLETCIKLRIDNGEDISDLIRALTGTISAPSLVTPAATPAANIEHNNDGTANLDSGHLTIEGKDANRKRKRKRAEVTEEQPRDDGVANTRRITVKPADDLMNFWNLCKTLRGQPRREPIEQGLTRAQQLPTLIENAERQLKLDDAVKAFHRLQQRCLLIELATMYVNLNKREVEIRNSFQKAGKLHGNYKGAVLDYMIGQMYDCIPKFSRLNAKDPRRKRVEDWLRLAGPLLTFTNHCGFIALIAPGIGIPDEAFRAGSAGKFETPCVRDLINTYGGRKHELSIVSAIMQMWIDGELVPMKLKIECLTEAEARTQIHCSLAHWGQYADPDADCNSLDGRELWLNQSELLPPATENSFWSSSQDATGSIFYTSDENTCRPEDLHTQPTNWATIV